MRKFYTFLFLFITCCAGLLRAQTTLNTTVGSTGYTGSNGAGAGYAITFVITNNSSAGILLTDVGNYYVSGNSGPVQLWYSSTSLSGAPGTLATPAWTQITSGNMTATATGVMQVFTGMNFLIPSGTTYRFALFSGTGSYCYYSGTGAGTCTPDSFTSNSVTLYTGDYQIGGNYVGYGGTNNPRFFTGYVTFVPALPCTSPPTPGTATASSSSVCQNSNFTLSLSGNSIGTGQTYQWQSSTTSTGTYTNVGTSQAVPTYSATATSTLYYRCAVTCGTSTVYSTPVQVTVPSLFPGGTYTINGALPTSGTNFHSFGDAVNAVACGISGPVIFNVVSGSGPYNEQVSMPVINTTSSVNTITFNGNGNTLSYSNSNASNYGIFQLNGTDWVTVNNLTIQPSGSYGFGVLLTNDADHNSINNCTVNGDITATSSAFAGIVISGASTSATTTNSSCDSNTISGNTVNGGYYGITCLGNSTTSQINGNQIINNTVKDFYLYGIYLNGNNNLLVEGNDISRPTRTTLSTFYGIYLSTGNLSCKISKNKVHNPFDGGTTSTSTLYGLYCTASASSGSENTFSNNILYNLNGNGTHYTIYNSSGAYARYYYNTVSSDYTAATAGTTYGMYIGTAVSGLDIKDNMISVTRGGTGTKYCIYFSSSTATFTGNNNNYYINSAGGTNNLGYYAGAAVTALSGWQSATSQDANSIAQNPVFTSASNLVPTSASVNNLGTPIAGITTDINNAARSATTPDIGAYEFSICAIPAGLTATNILSTSATVGWNTVSGATGYEYTVDQNAAAPSGSGTATTAVTANATGLTPGTAYYLHVRTNCGGGSYSQWATISFTTCVVPATAVTASGPLTFCQGDSVTLKAATGAGFTYQWKLNGANIGGATDSTYKIFASGTYTVVVSQGNCSSVSVASTVVVNPLPSAVITASGNTSICQGSTVTLNGNTGTGLTYQWQQNSTNITGATNASYTTGTAGTYTLNVMLNGCSNTTSATVVVSTPPTANVTASGPLTFCQGVGVTLTASAGTGYTYQWNLNGSPISGANTQAWYAGISGTYTVTVSSGACSVTSAAKVVTVLPTPTATITPGGPLTFCQGGSVILSANTGTGYTYQWKLNGTNITGATAATYTATASGIYTVTVRSGTCSATSSAVTVVVNVPPTATITASGPLTLCQGDLVTLNANTGTGYVYQWSLNGTAIPGATNSAYVTGTAGTYKVSVSHNNCATVSSPVTVIVNPLPTATITATGPLNFCHGGGVTLNANTGAGYTYQWQYNGTPIAGATGTSYTVSTAGSFTVVVTSLGCAVTSAAVITNFLISPEPIVIRTGGSGNTLITTKTYITYQWYEDGNAIAGANAQSYTVTTNGLYRVTVSDTTGCYGTSAIEMVPVLGVSSVAWAKDVRFYPNPAATEVYLDAPQPVNATVSGIEGKQLMFVENAHKIDVRSLANGIYMVRITDKNGLLIKVERLVKEGK